LQQAVDIQEIVQVVVVTGKPKFLAPKRTSKQTKSKIRFGAPKRTSHTKQPVGQIINLSSLSQKFALICMLPK
jgi:hypothetical protein